MEGKIRIEENQERHASCNCCSALEEVPRLWDIRFTFGGSSTLIKVCEKHLKELENEIERQLS